MSSVAEPVEAKGNAVSLEELGALIERNTHHVVTGVEAGILRPLSGKRSVSVVNPVVPPVIEEAPCAGSLFVVVFHGKRGYPARNALVAVEQWSRHRTGIGGIEMCHVYISTQVPVFGHFISQFGISAVLLKSHISPMPVGTIV